MPSVPQPEGESPMSGRKSENLRSEPPRNPRSGRRWPPSARQSGLGGHAVPPRRRCWPGRWGRPRPPRRWSSRLTRRSSRTMIDQGYAYRYYAPEPPPTPVVVATIHYADGRPDATIRLPARGLCPGCCVSAATGAGQPPHDDFEAARGEGRRRQPEPLGALVCPAPGEGLPRLHGVTLHVADAPDPRTPAGPRDPRGAVPAGGSTSTPRSSTRRPSGSENTRATPI